MIRLAAALCLFAGAATAQTATCDDFEPILDAMTANVQVFTGMVRWCMDDRLTDPACIHLNQLSKNVALPDVNLAASAAAVNLQILCRPD